MKINRILLTIFFLIFSIYFLHAQKRGGDLEVVTTDGEPVVTFSQGYALVIGEINYKYWDQLKSVKEDVDVVKKLLEEQKFIVETLVDKTGEELRRGIENFLNKYGHDENARLIIYYAGHGATYTLSTDKKMGYIVPIDAPSLYSDSRGFLQRAIPMNQFDTWSTQYACRHILFIFDSCFSGSIFTTRSAALPPAISKSLTEPVRQFITSGSENESVPEPSVFRPLLERALRNGEADLNKDGYVTGTELGMYIKSEVLNRYNGKWNPQYGKSQDVKLDKGDFIFVTGNSKTNIVVPTPPPFDNNIKIQDQIKTGDKITAESFIGTWLADVNYNGNFDTYKINFTNNGRCTVKLSNDAAEQETTGNWSYDSSTQRLKLNAIFRNAKITYQRSLEWITLVSFTEGNNSFYILAKPAANAPNNIRFTFFRE